MLKNILPTIKNKLKRCLKFALKCLTKWLLHKSKFDRYLKYKENYGTDFFFIPLVYITVNLTDA